MKKEIKLNIFIILLILLASLPFGVLGHEVWHLIFAGTLGAKPMALCVNFGDEARFASALIDYEVTEITDCQLCELRYIDELTATAITIGITFLMLFIFSKKYIKLLNKDKQ